MRRYALVSLCFFSCILSAPAGQDARPGLDYDRIAAHIESALELRKGERVVLRADPGAFRELIPRLERRIRASGAAARLLEAGDSLTDQVLESTDVVVLLPLGSSARKLTEAEEGCLTRWLGDGGARRELHFHWADGTRRADGLPDAHPPEFDALYQSALELPATELNAAQERAIRVLRLGTVRISTPAGTDFMFRIALRPMNKQNGDASPGRAASAVVQVDREIELPAGALRAAPVEQSAFGQIALPEARFGDTVARKVFLFVDNGRITGVRAEEGLEAVKAALASGGEAASRFGGFALGFNPKLAVEPGSRLVPYYGYGAGVVRLSFGDNRELGGAVSGDSIRWFFLTDATLHVDYRYLVRGGKLTLDQLPE